MVTERDGHCAGGGIRRSSRNARHYKSSSVLNCAGNLLGPNLASGSGQHPPNGPAALPRLASALKSWIHSASGNSPSSKSKPAFVDAGDEVIYYSNVGPPSQQQMAAAEKSSQKSGGATGGKRGEENGEGKGEGRSPSLGRVDSQRQQGADAAAGRPFSASSSSSHYFSHRQPTTLDQIRQLYKSVPNFSSFDDGEEGEESGGGGHGIAPEPRSKGVHKQSSPFGRLCPVKENPPPVQPQRKRIFQQQQQQKSAPDHTLPSNSTPCSSASSSLQSANSAKWQSSAALEQVAEQCEKAVVPVDCCSGGGKAGTPPGSLASCSLGSGSSNISSRLSSSSQRRENPKKVSPTDSGYRSRGETPNGGRQQGRARPVSMLCASKMMEQLSHQQQHSAAVPSPVNGRQKLCVQRRYIWMEKEPEERHLSRRWPFSVGQMEAILKEEVAFEEQGGGQQMRQVAELLCQAFADLLGRFWTELRRLTGVLTKCTPRDCCTAALLLLPSELAWECLRNVAKALDWFANSPSAAEGPPTRTTRSISERARIRHLHAGQFLRWLLESRVSVVVDELSAVSLCALFDWLLCQCLQLLQRDSAALIAQWTVQLVANPPASASGSAHSFLLSQLRQSRPFSKRYRLLCPTSADSHSSLSALVDLLARVPLAKLVFSGEFPILESQMFGGEFAGPAEAVELAMDEESVPALHYWLHCPQWRGRTELEDWLRTASIFAVHRRSKAVRQCDLMQAARLVLPPCANFDCPPPSVQEYLRDARPAGCFCPATKSVLLGHSPPLSSMENACWATKNASCPEEFPQGWSPLCWAIALQQAELVQQMLAQPGAARAVREDEKLLQICAHTGDLSLCELLLRHGANPFLYSLSTGKSPVGAAGHSAFAISAARGDLPLLQLFIGCCSVLRRNSRQQFLLFTSAKQQIAADERTTLSSLLEPTKFAHLSELEKRSFGDALQLAAETGQFELVLRLHSMGAPLPGGEAWLDCAEWLIGRREQQQNGPREEADLEQLLRSFGPRTAEEVMAGGPGKGQRRAELLADLLFDLLRPSSSSAKPTPASLRGQVARVLSCQFLHIQKGSLSQLEREFSIYFPALAHNGGGSGGQSDQPTIDPKFVDSPDLSDIRFRFADGQIVFAHRIVLVNASEQFRQMLRSPSGVVDVPNCGADCFRLLLEFVYGNNAKCVSQLSKASVETQIELVRMASHFGLVRLADTGQRAMGAALAVARFARVYKFAKEAKLSGLQEDCERFAMAHLPELLDCLWDEGHFGSGQQREELLSRMKAQFRMAVRESRI